MSAPCRREPGPAARIKPSAKQSRSALPEEVGRLSFQGELALLGIVSGQQFALCRVLS